jgi:acetyltransferase-like isoleucine patch superfamily enzyme
MAMVHKLKQAALTILTGFVNLLYPKCRDINPLHILAVSFIPQKVLRINGSVPWPVHFTSRVLYHENISIGRRAAPGFSSCCYIQGRNGIRIGNNFRMGPGVGLVSANHNIDDYDTWTRTDPIIIGDSVWIGMNSVVLPGVKIGTNVVIGANAVVDSDIPDNSIALGNPCRVVKEKTPYEGNDYSQ